jgi:phosphotransferase system enzyme I (PtsP)
MLRPQLRALISAGAGRDLYIMFPLVTLPGEIDAVRALLDREVERAKKRKQKLPSTIRIGAMIETPAAAWRTDLIAAKVDFLSVGGNDLAQFYFAADRDSERVQRRYDPMNPGFLSFLKTAVQKAEKAKSPISYCGEQAADPVTAAALIGLGVRQFSVPATSVGPFRRLVRSVSASEISTWLDERLQQPLVTLRPEFADFLKKAGAALE